MTKANRLAWEVAFIDGILVLLIAVLVGRVESRDPATTSSFDHALPYAVAALAPLAFWLGRCHFLGLQTKGAFMLVRVLVSGALASMGVLLCLALGPLLTPSGWSQLTGSLNAPHGVGNTIGAFIILALTVPAYAAVGAVVATWVAGINWIVYYFTTGGAARSA
jgi:hypothetical protein